mgnify:CR=1 FL=1
MNRYKESLRQYFSVQAKALRKKRKLTQEEMSEQLHITVRAYGDLERGCSCCSAIALLFFLLMLEPDELTAFLAQMKKQFREQDQQVLLCMQKQTADLLLMDTALPDVCGLTVLDELQRRGTAPQRVILLSSIVSEQVTDQAFALGVSHFIPKPFHTDLLFDAMYELFPGCSCGHWPHSPQ